MQVKEWKLTPGVRKLKMKKSLENELVVLTLQKAQKVCIHSEINNVGGLEELHFLMKRELP